MQRLLWTLWALAPVIGLAYHYGPGQRALRLDDAARLQRDARKAERAAIDEQQTAYEAHLAAIDARRAAFLSDSPSDLRAAEEDTAEEEAAYKRASDAWKEVADLYEQIENLTTDLPAHKKMRWAKARALVRAGEVFNGIDELDALLSELSDGDDAELPNHAKLLRATRAELAAANYYGARLMRLAGETAADWRAVSGRARQHYRYLAERAVIDGKDNVAEAMQRNVELVLNLEQQDRSEVEGRALPRESPRRQREGDRRPGEGRGKTRRPPQERDGRGAGGLSDISSGW